MVANRWHWHQDSTVKRDAEKMASRLKAKSAWRKKYWFKVRVRAETTMAPRTGKKVKYYIVEWWGPNTAL